MRQPSRLLVKKIYMRIAQQLIYFILTSLSIYKWVTSKLRSEAKLSFRAINKTHYENSKRSWLDYRLKQ
jgi:hypothetical protein